MVGESAGMRMFVAIRVSRSRLKEGQGSALDPLGPEAPDPH